MSTEASNQEPERDLQEQRQAIKMSIEDAKFSVALMNDLARLRNSEAWKRLIDQHYFKDYALGRVMLKADPSMQNQQQQMDIEAKLQAVAHFNIFLHYVDIEGMHAVQALKDANQELDLLDDELGNQA